MYREVKAMDLMERHSDAEVDPDPFIFGLALLGVVIGGASYLEARRQRHLMEGQAKKDANRFRTRWYNAKRTLLRAHQVLDEFEAAVAAYRFGHHGFAFGSVRLAISRSEARQLRAMVARINAVTNAMSRDIDALSEFLDPEYQPVINRIMNRLQQGQMPHTYDAVIILVKDAVEAFDTLLSEAGSRQGFSD